jgi:hypothetical protein
LFIFQVIIILPFTIGKPPSRHTFPFWDANILIFRLFSKFFGKKVVQKEKHSQGIPFTSFRSTLQELASWWSSDDRLSCQRAAEVHEKAIAGLSPEHKKTREKRF